MVEAQPQFTPKQILEAGQRAVAEGRIEYARQFFQHLIDRYGDTPEAASARSEIMGLAPPAAPPPANPSHRQPDWLGDPATHRAELTSDRHAPREALPPFVSDHLPERRPPDAGGPAPSRVRALAPAPEKNYIAGRVFTGLLAVVGFLGLPLGIVMVYGVVADPGLFETAGITRFAGGLWASFGVFFASIGLILVAQVARAVFDAADAAHDLARLERYRLGLDDEDD